MHLFHIHLIRNIHLSTLSRCLVQRNAQTKIISQYFVFHIKQLSTDAQFSTLKLNLLTCFFIIHTHHFWRTYVKMISFHQKLQAVFTFLFFLITTSLTLDAFHILKTSKLQRLPNLLISYLFIYLIRYITIDVLHDNRVGYCSWNILSIHQSKFCLSLVQNLW